MPLQNTKNLYRMKHIYIQFLFIFLATGLFGQQRDEGLMSERLLKALEESPNEYHHISILLTDRVDIRSMDQAFYLEQASLSTRTQAVITALKAKANETQPFILDLLRASDEVDQESIKPFWVTNVIFTKGKKSVVEALSRLPEVEWLDLNGQLELDEYTDVACNVTVAPGVPEPGLKAIKADKLWQMGYTGYGTVAMTADTGIDPSHPSISNNSRSLTVPASEAWFDANNNNNFNPSNCGDHGTHTLGTMVGIDRSTFDTIGVAFNAQWIGSNVLCGNGTMDNIATFQWALNPDGDAATIEDMPTVINNSWFDPLIAVGEDCMSAYVDVLTAMETAGVAIVFSAGNSGSGPSTITTPKNINTDLVNIFAVAAVNGNNPNFTVAGFSSRGPSTCGGEGSLLIKPEVSAPGVDVRSCVFDGLYGLKSGTSMAAPHVCGAILLLKEAFPELTGTELKLALYFSCSDLGAAGEDNTYGMGMINVEGAFNYLVEQGNTPVSPLVENDIVLIDVEAEMLNCEQSIPFDLVMENGGTQALTSATINYSFVTDGGVVVLENSINWTGNLSSGEIATLELQVDNVPEGAYDLIVAIIEPNGMEDARKLNNVKTLTNISVSQAEPLVIGQFQEGSDNPCLGGEAYVFVDVPEDTQVEWFFNEIGGSPISFDNPYLVPALGSNFTLYVTAAKINANVGITDLDPNNSALANNNEGSLVFDAFANFYLKSVKVYVEEPGFRQVAIRNEDGFQVTQWIFNLTETGEQRLDLGIEIEAGNNYSLEINAGAAFSHSTNASYPYTIGNIMNIKRSGDFVNPLDNYYYFYDWEIEHGHPCGDRIPYTIEYQNSTDAPDAVFEPSAFNISINDGGNVDFTNTSTNGTSYSWNFGDGNTSNAENPSHIYTEEGIYTIVLTVSNADGCTDTGIQTIEVSGGVTSVDELSEGQNIRVFPNPTSDKISVLFDLSKTTQVDVQLTDLLGRSILSLGTESYLKEEINIDLSAYSSGVYFLVCQLKDQKFVKKIIKMD